MVLFLTTGAIFVMWLGEQITERGVGNGASLIIFFSIIERFWPGIFDTFRFVSTGATNVVKLIALGFVMVGVVAGVIAITVAARRVPIQIPQRTMARGRMRDGAKSFIPLRINSAGVMPIIFAQSVIVVPGAIAQFAGTRWPMARDLADVFRPGSVAYYMSNGGPDRVLHLLLHVHHFQSGGPGRESQEAGRIHSGREARDARQPSTSTR